MIEILSAYIPMDRRHALARDESLPDRTHGAAVFADISGFTPLTEALALELGPKRGAEELSIHLNRVLEAIIAPVHHFGGSVIGFAGAEATSVVKGETLVLTLDYDGAAGTAAALASAAGTTPRELRFATLESRLIADGALLLSPSGHEKSPGGFTSGASLRPFMGAESPQRWCLQAGLPQVEIGQVRPFRCGEPDLRDLVRQALEENLSEKAIKQRVKNWRADHHRGHGEPGLRHFSGLFAGRRDAGVTESEIEVWLRLVADKLYSR